MPNIRVNKPNLPIKGRDDDILLNNSIKEGKEPKCIKRILYS